MKVRNQVNFAIVPEWVIYAEISAQAVRLYAVLNRHASSRTSRCTIRQKVLGDKMGVSSRSVARALAELVKIGAVEVENRFTGAGQAANQYLVRQVPPMSNLSGGGVKSVRGPHVSGVRRNENHITNESPPTPQRGERDASQKDQTPHPRDCVCGGMGFVLDDQDLASRCPCEMRKSVAG